MRPERFLKQFNWRFLLVRILVNAIALAVTALIVPKIYFVDTSIWNWLLMALMLGVLNSLVKPILQTLTLHFIFVTYGLVIVIVNAVILWLLSFLFPDRFAVTSLFWALVGGLVLGVLSSFLESLLGLSMPIVPDEPPELRQQIREQAEQIGWVSAGDANFPVAEVVPGAEPLPSGGESHKDGAEPVGQERAAQPESKPDPEPPEPPQPEPDEELAPAPAGSEAAISEDSEPAPEPQEGAKEDPS